MEKIRKIDAFEVLDSRGKPTVEVDIYSKRHHARAIVPSGASKGAREAVEIRDHGSRFHGDGVVNAVHNATDLIAARLLGMDCTRQDEIDLIMNELDGTSNKSKIGANAILGVSMAVARLAAKANKMPLYRYIAKLCGEDKCILPVPCMNVINGGAHAGNTLDFQEFMIIPTHADNFAEAVRMCAEVYHTLKEVIKNLYGKSATNVGDEGGFAPQLTRTEDALKLLMASIRENEYEGRIMIGLDAAASQFYKDGLYELEGQKLTDDKLIEFYESLCSRYPIISIEDPFHEEAFDSFAKLNEAIGKTVQIVGDDLLVTHVNRIRLASEKRACNALLLKLNQIGTVTEAINAAKIAVVNDFGIMVSHRSGDTEDTFIADFSVGISSGQIKSGAPCRAERTAKYNQLMRIEEELGARALYAGKYFRHPRKMH